MVEVAQLIGLALIAIGVVMFLRADIARRAWRRIESDQKTTKVR